MDSDTDALSETEYDSMSNTNQGNSMWDKIQRLTYVGNKNVWYQLLSQDKVQFQLKFKEAYLEHCKTWLSVFNDFIGEDETWASLMETKSKIYENVEGDEDEALLSAVDARRYKIFKLIDWDKLEADIEQNSDDSDDGEAGEEADDGEPNEEVD